ncbi:MAG: response regulator [Phycisphaerales bacterium]
MTESIRVLFADDSPDIVSLYARLIDGEADLVCVGTLFSAVHLEEAVRAADPHVAVVDLGMPGPDPLRVVAAIAPGRTGCQFIAFTGYDDAETRDRAFEAGFCALVSKHDHPLRVLEEVRRAVGRPPRAG